MICKQSEAYQRLFYNFPSCLLESSISLNHVSSAVSSNPEWQADMASDVLGMLL
jgi:hypothetical protein